MRDRPAPEHFATSQRPEPSPHPQGRVDGTRPARPDGEVGLHAARRLDAQPHRGSGLRGTQATVPAFPRDERDVSPHQVPDVREIHLPKEVVQLASLAPRQRRLEGQECVPGAVLDRHAEQEEAKLELGSGDHERRHRSSRSQIGNLDRDSSWSCHRRRRAHSGRGCARSARISGQRRTSDRRPAALSSAGGERP